MRTGRWTTTVLATAALMAGCGEGERAAPPASALTLPESLRVAGHEHRCPEAADAPCTRTLLLAPALEAEKPLATGAQLRDELRPALRAEGWSTTEADDFTATSADGEETARVLLPARDELAGTQLESQLRSMVDDGQPVLVVDLRRTTE
ncbi:MAG: hypothetical protein ACEQSX_02265 [Baekduiaceae bacterium]